MTMKNYINSSMLLFFRGVVNAGIHEGGGLDVDGTLLGKLAILGLRMLHNFMLKGSVSSNGLKFGLRGKITISFLI